MILLRITLSNALESIRYKVPASYFKGHQRRCRDAGAVLNPAHTKAMEAAMSRHEAELKRKTYLRELQEADHQSKIHTDNAEIKRE